MPDLTPDEVRAMAGTLGLAMTPDDLAEVTHRLNAFIEALAPLDALPLIDAEPVPTRPPAPEGAR